MPSGFPRIVDTLPSGVKHGSTCFAQLLSVDKVAILIFPVSAHCPQRAATTVFPLLA